MSIPLRCGAPAALHALTAWLAARLACMRRRHALLRCIVCLAYQQPDPLHAALCSFSTSPPSHPPTHPPTHTHTCTHSAGS